MPNKRGEYDLDNDDARKERTEWITKKNQEFQNNIGTEFPFE